MSLSCKICGHIANKSLAKHINAVHNISAKEYRVKYPGAKVMSDEVRQKWRDRSKGSNNPMFGTHRAGVDNPFYGKKHSKSTRELISKNRKGKCCGEDHWLYGKGHLVSGEANSNFGPNPNLQGENNPFYGKKHSKEVIESLRKNPKCRNGRKYIKISPEEYSRRLSAALKGRKFSKTHRRKLSEAASKRNKSTGWSKRGEYKGVKFQSSYECLFLIQCYITNLEVTRATSLTYPKVQYQILYGCDLKFELEQRGMSTDYKSYEGVFCEN